MSTIGSRRGRGSLAVAAVVVLVGILAASCGSGDPEVATPVGERQDLAGDGVHELPAPPLADRQDEVRVWTGREVVVWGGRTRFYAPSHTDRTLGDGATLSLDDGRWTPMSESPFPHGLYSPLGAYDGTEVIVIGTECDETIPPGTAGTPPACPDGPAAAAFDPGTNGWRRLPPPPIPTSSVGQVAVITASASAGGDGVAAFLVTSEGLTITWDRAANAWSTTDVPFGATNPPAANLSAACADQSRRELVAMQGSGLAGSAIRSLRPGAGWSAPVTAPVGFAPPVSCGDGLVVRSSSTGPIVIVDVATGVASPAGESADVLTNGWVHAVGPWLMRTELAMPIITTTTVTTVAPGDTSVAPATVPEAYETEHVVDVRRTDGGPWTRLDVPPAYQDKVMYVGEGLVGGNLVEGQPDSGFWFWRAPDEMQ